MSLNRSRLRAVPLAFSAAAYCVTGCTTEGGGRDGRGSEPANQASGNANGNPNTVPGAGGTGGSTGGNGNTGGSPVSLPPSGPLGPIAVRRLSTPEYQRSVEALPNLNAGASVTSGFLSDDEVLGYHNMTSALRVPLAVAEQYAVAAKQLGQKAMAEAQTLAPCSGASDAQCGEAFIRSFGQSAYRRPLAESEVASYVQLFSAEVTRTSYAGGIGLVVETMLQSPYFLYKTEVGAGTGPSRELTPHEIASQISYAIAGEPPDEQLYAAAASGSLATTAGRVAEARRFLARPNSTAWIRGFVLDWLGISNAAKAVKDGALFPSFSTGLQASMVEESHRFVDTLLTEHNGSLSTLFTANWSPLDSVMASHYGVPAPGSAWTSVTMPPARLGILSQAAFLSAHSKPDSSYPIGRGKTLRMRVLCAPMAPPPPNIPPFNPPPEATTTREKLAAHSTNPTCNSCHRLIDPLGLGFENFDAVGAYRDSENGSPVDTQGAIVDVAPEVDGPFATPAEFINRVAQSQVLRSCISREMLRWSLGREETAADGALISAMGNQLMAANLDIRELIVGLVQAESYPFRSDM
ncbi:MAG: DUF1592 domain-containing protein [Polyangiaceae bacterium]|nr:DUF1592 domain-containing protein [Polyangiaceae bacterium]